MDYGPIHAQAAQNNEPIRSRTTILPEFLPEQFI